MVDGLTEIDLCRRTDAIGAVTEIDLIQIELEDLIFAQQLLNADRQEHFLNLTHQRAFGAEEEVSRKLLRDGARPLRGVTREQRNAGRTEDPHRVNAVVLIEATVFCSNKGFDHFRRDLVERDRNTTFLTILRDELAICAVNLHRDLQTHIFKRRDVR